MKYFGAIDQGTTSTRFIVFNENGEMVPALAEEIPTKENGGVSADQTSLTWKLKKGVKWSDGSEFTADDVKFSAEY